MTIVVMDAIVAEGSPNIWVRFVASAELGALSLVSETVRAQKRG